MDFNFSRSIELTSGEIDLLAVGETVVDLISVEESGSFAGAENFRRYFGGSPANITMNLANLGRKTALISRVGSDGLGKYLISRLKERGVDVSGISRDEKSNTTLILVTRSQESPEFLAYRGADTNLSPKQISAARISKARVIHLSGFALTIPRGRQTIEKVIKIAREQNKILSLDPNYRPQLWQGGEIGPEYIKNMLAEIDIVKPSLDDASFFFGERSREAYINKFHEAGAGLVILTLGADGLLASTGESQQYLPSLAGEVVDTTGAGDAFWSGFYAGILQQKNLLTALKLGSAAAAEVLKQTGALVNMPPTGELLIKYDIN